MRDGTPGGGGKAVPRFRFAAPVLAGIVVSLSLWGGPLAASAHEKRNHPAAAPPPGAQGEQQGKATKPALGEDAGGHGPGNDRGAPQRPSGEVVTVTS